VQSVPYLRDNIGVLLIQRALSTLWDFPALTRRHCDMPQAFQFLDSNLPPDSNHLRWGDWGALAILFGVLVMGTDHPPRDKQAHLAKPSLWVAEPADDILSLLENALREDEPSLWDGEHTDEGNSPA
jgi:hypothetical protein